MHTIRGAADLAEYIGKNYSGRVVEIGVGCAPDVALCLMQRWQSLQVTVTDKKQHSLGSLSVQKDDLLSPRLDLYQGASLLYSIRPPLELQQVMGALACQIGADVLIRPLEDEIADLPGFCRSLVNSGEARFYLFRLKP